MVWHAGVRLANRLGAPLFNRWIAGRTPKEVLQYAKGVNLQGGKTTLHFLGEKQKDPQQVHATVSEYLNLLSGIHLARVQADVAFKLSQLGFDLPENGPVVCEENLRTIVRTARQRDIFCWIDMESLRYVPETLAFYRKFLHEFGNVGICLQANLKRSEADLQQVATWNSHEPTIRLVKGIYPAPEQSAYARKEEINRALAQLLALAFENPRVRVALATHDEQFILQAHAQAKKRNKKFELQMLKGVREPLQRKLLSEGVALNVYAPYGQNVFAYGIRRAREAKEGIYPKMLTLAFGWLYDKAYKN